MKDKANNDLSQSYLFGFYGALIGDACGVPFEFSTKEEVEELGALNINYPFDVPGDTQSDFRRAHKTAPPNAWSDDGAQMLALMDSVLQSPQQNFSLDLFGKNLLKWYKALSYSVDDQLFDIGNQTKIALRNLLNGQAPDNSGLDQECHNGNGSLMRSLGLVFSGLGEQGPEALVNASMDQSLPTHAHIRSLCCCAILNTFGFLQAQKGASANIDLLVSEAFQVVRTVLLSQNDQEALVELDVIEQHQPNTVLGSPYVVDTLWSSIHALKSSNNAQEAICAAILMGNDTDTTATITGGLAGLRWQAEGFPHHWKDNLPAQRDFDRVASILEERSLNSLVSPKSPAP